MTTFYLDPVAGNDANAGTSFALRWKTYTAGATAARIAPGDTVRVISSPDPTSLGQSVGWTNGSRALVLAAAVTANIATCESSWTAAANVTTTTSTGTFREGTRSSSITPATAFTTGKIAHFPTGTLDLSAYQQVSLQLRSTLELASGVLQLKLCSDTTGDTPLHTFTIPALGAAQWEPIVFDNAGALSAVVASVALYAVSDPGTPTIHIDNIVAAKASSSADSLTHQSMIGKVHNLAWAATTAYSLNDIRKPTAANRNGFGYKATTAGTTAGTEPTWPQDIGKTVTDGSVVWTCTALEETWWPVGYINGVDVGLGGSPDTSAMTSARGYAGVTETVLTYKRETLKVTPQSSGTGNADMTLQDSGTAAAPIVLSGGWNRTDMSTQTGESWLDGATGFGAGLVLLSKVHWTLKNLHHVRFWYPFTITGTGIVLDNLHTVANALGGDFGAASRATVRNLVMCSNGDGYTGGSTSNLSPIKCLQFLATTGTTPGSDGIGFGMGYTDVNYFWMRNNDAGSALLFNSSNAGTLTRVKNFLSDNNAATNLLTAARGGGFDFISPVFGEASPIPEPAADRDCYYTVTRYNATDDDHRRITDGGTIRSATDQRHTASGIAWKFLPTSTNRDDGYPLRLPLAKIVVGAGQSKTVTVWTRRDATDIKGRLVMRGGQLPGLEEQTVDCTPTINTWEQSASLTIAPTGSGVVELEFHCWDGVGTTNSFWIDDLTVT